MPSHTESRKVTAATVAFLVAFLLVGLLVFKDYGISWDEFPTRQFGVMYVEHLIPDAHTLDSLRVSGGPAYERFGPVFEILLVRAEKLLPRMDIRSTFMMRHLITFLVYFVGVVLFQRLCRRRFGPGISLLACVCLVISPLLFSHAFYNVKDIAFLTMFVASMLTLDSVLRRPGWRTMLLHAATTAILFGTRVLGVFPMMLTAGAMLIQRPTRRTLGLLVGYGVVVALLLPIVWPVLRIDFLRIVHDAVLGSTSNPYRGVNLFRGRMIDASALPWDYVPTWMLITTPYIVSALFLLGLGVLLVRFARKPRELVNPDRQLDVLVLCWFLLPVLGTMILRPIMYDSWRHLFFVIPALVYLAAVGMEAIFNFALARVGEGRRPMVSMLLSTALLLCLAPVVNFMVRNHPFEHVYFNRFAGSDMKEVKQRFELDYWGLSYRKALEYIVHTDSASQIRIFAATYPGRVNVAMLLPQDRLRVVLVPTLNEADYFVTNYRFHPDDYQFPYEVFSVRVGNASIASVFESGTHHLHQLRPNSGSLPR
ncbi:MAG: hypothetical protein ABI625_09395 [bacterium]